MESFFLTEALATLKMSVGDAFSFLNSEVQMFLSAASLLAWSLAVGMWLAEGMPGRHVPLLRKFLLLVTISWLLSIFPSIALRIMEAAANTGNIMVPGGGFDFSDPGQIALFGLTAADPLLMALDALSGFPEVFLNIPDIIFLVIAWLAAVFSFLVIALCVLIAWIEWGLLSTAVYVLLPLAVLGPTNFAAERAIGYVAATAVRFLVLGAIVAVTGLLLANLSYENPENPSLVEAFGVLGICLACLFAALRAPAAAAGLIIGGPSLSGAEALRTLASAAGTALRTTAVGGGLAVGAAGTAAALAGRSAAGAGQAGGARLERMGGGLARAGLGTTRLALGLRPAPRDPEARPMSASQRRALDHLARRTARPYDPHLTHAQAEREIARRRALPRAS